MNDKKSDDNTLKILHYYDHEENEMTHPEKNMEREERIHMEIVVDANGPEEQAIGWHTYLSDTLHFPFTAQCVTHRITSPLEPGDKVEVVGIASEDVCEHDMFVLIRWKQRQLAVPLIQFEGIQVDEETQQAIEDWHYWVNRGYAF
jgi:hypothetical protein